MATTSPFRRVATASAFTTALVLSLVAAPPAMAQPRAPLGYQLMCLKTPAICQGGGASKIEASNDVLAVLKKVNGQVNRSIRPKADSGADIWTVGARAGDCEDYVMAKRTVLINSGLPASALRIAHVKTSQADLVLDNLTPAIKPLAKTGYKVIAMSGANPLKWT